MRVGVVKEIKTDEYRVALTPAGARELVQHGHEVLVETGAGDGSSFPDATYETVGAHIGSVDDVWSKSDPLLKVKEPISSEYGRLREGLVLSSTLQLEESVTEDDVVIGAVLIPGALAAKLIKRETLRTMKDGAVLCDVAIDQGGCAETSRPTTHSDPVYEVEGVTHYCVANMPGAVPITATKALTNATLPYVEAIANYGLAEAVARDRSLARGVNV